MRNRDLPSYVIRRGENEEVLRYLAENHPSAHSDVSSEMIEAARELRNVHSYAPAPSSYSYELLHTEHGVIFCVAVGQSTLLFRIPLARRDETLSSRGQPFPSLGPAWIALDVFATDRPLAEWRALLKKYCRTALTSAK